MKIVFVMLCIIGFCCCNALSQDIITKNDGEEIRTRVLEILPLLITYKMFDNPDGPTYSVLKSEITKIRFSNGVENTFNEAEPDGSRNILHSPTEPVFRKGREDASKYYKGYEPAATGTFCLTLVSPVLGLIPAIVCSNAPPKSKMLMIPDTVQIRKSDYYNGYRSQAKTIKSSKVWKNWKIALCINIGLTILLLKKG